jgi:hypothetical protein
MMGMRTVSLAGNELPIGRNRVQTRVSVLNLINSTHTQEEHKTPPTCRTGAFKDPRVCRQRFDFFAFFFFATFLAVLFFPTAFRPADDFVFFADLLEDFFAAFFAAVFAAFLAVFFGVFAAGCATCLADFFGAARRTQRRRPGCDRARWRG